MHPALRPIAANLDGAVIALDFDGTLAPIVSDPSRSRPVPGAIDTLRALSDAGARVAIITGRDARTVVALGDLRAIPGVFVSGLHGAETWQAGNLETRDEPPGLDELRRELPPLLEDIDPRVWLEDKRLSLVVHTRQAADPEQALALLEPQVKELAKRHGLEMHPGKLVLEIRIPGLSKADALARLLSDEVPAAIFAGDDLGDLPAFEALRDWSRRAGRPGLTIAVGDVAEVRDAADLQLDDPEQLARELAGLRSK
jgi:trehalose 6-phosphate phosphatase